jgi:pyruvate carboxylase
MGGWPKKVQRVVLGDRKPLTARPGAVLKPLNLKKVQAEISAKLRHDASEDDVYSYLMYPEVFLSFTRYRRDYGDLSVLPSPAFFYGLKIGEEITISIEEGKTLFVRLVYVSPVDNDGRRTVLWELNGMARQTTVADRSVQPKTKVRPKAESNVPTQVGAPIPGLVTSLPVTVGAKVSKSDKLLTLEAMKMQTTVYSPCDGLIEEVCVHVGDTVESKDLLIRIKAAT